MAMYSSLFVHAHGSNPMAASFDPATQLVHGNLIVLMRRRYRKLRFLYDTDESIVEADYQVGSEVRFSFHVPIMKPGWIKLYIHLVMRMRNLILHSGERDLVSEKLTALALSYAAGNEIKSFNVAADFEFLHEEFYMPEVDELQSILDQLMSVQFDNLTMEEGSLPSTAIDKLKMVTFEGPNGDRCSVCLEDFCVGMELVSMPCSHLFHQSCIVPWLERNNACPLCRRPLSD